jgi:hypothetical protein
MSYFQAEDHNRHWLLGTGMTALVATMTVLCFVTEVKAGCEAELSAVKAANRYLSETHTICGGTLQHLTTQQTAACEESRKAEEASTKCIQRLYAKEEEARRAAKATAAAERANRLRKSEELNTQELAKIHNFVDGLRIGMTSAETDAAEKQTFQNPLGYGRTVNTTVTANGAMEQWVYPFSHFSGMHNVYLYFNNGVLTAIQK